MARAQQQRSTQKRSTRKRNQGRRPIPHCHPSRPYSEWPSVQLLGECARRGIRVIRKGPRFNASKDHLALILRQSDAERSLAAGEQLSGSVSAAPSNEPEQSSIRRDDAAATHGGCVSANDVAEATGCRESQEIDDEHETSLDFEGAEPRSEQDEQEIDGERELSNEQQQRAAKTEYNATFRLVNVLFSRYASQFDEIMDGTFEDAARIAKRRVWIDVCNSFYSPVAAFSTLINDHAMFADIDPSLQPPQHQIQSRRAIVRMWKSLSATYSRALQHARLVDADDAQFYAVCGGRLDVLYLHLWLLLEPQLATHFAPESPDPLQTTSNSSARDKLVATTATTTTTEKTSPRNQAQETNSAVLGLKRKRMESNDSTLTPAAQGIHTETSPALEREYMKLKLEVLREKKALLAASAAREQMRFLEERRRGLLRDVRELSTAVADLQQRLVVQSTAAASRRDGTADRDATPTTHARVTRQTAATGAATDAAVAELTQDLGFFSRQKRQRVVDVAQCDQQIQELGVGLLECE